MADSRRAKFDAALNTKVPFVWEDEKVKNGEPDIINRTFYPVLDSSGEVKYVLGFGQNVTNLRVSQRSLEEKANRLTELNARLKEAFYMQQRLNTELDGYKTSLDLTSIVSVTDRNGVIMHANKIFCDTSKYEESELIGKTHKIIDSGHHNKAFFEGMWAALLAGKTWNSTIKNKAKDGSYYWVDSTIVPFINETGEIWQYMCVARDITSIMAAQAKIETINTELEQTVKERTEKLEKTNLQLEGFIATVSHDLRSPLRNMSSYASLIEKYLPADKSNDVVDMLGIIKKSASHMNTIITELLKLAHIGKKQLVESKVDLTEMVNGLVKDIYQNNKETTAKINVEPLEPCLGDEGMLQQVWVNLLSNAVKYSAKVECPEINIGMALDKKGEPIYYIRDNGAGFDSSKADNLFKPFRRMHSSDEFEGTGIGLSIVHNIVTAHGGEIWAESRPGQGCTFFLKLKSAKNLRNQDTIIKQMVFNANHDFIKSGTD